MTDDVFMPCAHPGCGRESTHCTDRWIVYGHHLHVDYWCAEHAPSGATSFEEEEANDASSAGGEGDRTGVGFWFDLAMPGVGDLTPEVMNALFEAGCDDATPYRRDGRTYLLFAREAASRAKAIASAMRDVGRAGFGAELDEPAAGAGGEPR